MGESKHTPGKWVARRHQNAAYGARHGGRFVIIAESPGEVDFFVAEQRHPMATGESESQSEANARLIAAAPDLLTSLVECVRMLEAVRYTAGLGKHQMERLGRAKAAIAKAEGRTDA